MLISNPLTSELTIPLTITFLSLLAFGLIGIICAAIKSKDHKLNRQLFLRWLSWSLITPLTVLSILSGPLVFALVAAVISTVCTHELCSMTKQSNATSWILYISAAALPMLACLAPAYLPLGLTFLAMVLAFISMKENLSFQAACMPLVALFYVPLLSTHAVLLLKIAKFGPQLLICIITASALANIMAFVFGKLLGGPKIAAKISPNKTWSGVFGSFVGAALGFSLVCATCELKLDTPLLISLPLVVAGVGVLGDLFESMLKRSFSVKDAGTWLPGFGGALDRVDGLLFILPCVYYLVSPII